MKHALIVLLVLMAPLTLQAAPLTIVVDGTAQAAIVIQPDEPKASQAGQALQEYIEKISGAKLPLIEEGQPTPPVASILLLVGHTQAARDADITIPSGYDTSVREDIFEEEGYVLKTIGSNIIIAGNNDGPYKGTIFAAYALLERLGCRWYFPGKWGEVLPQSKTITVPDLDIVSRPDFPMRGLGLSGWTPVSGEESNAYHRWAERIGMTSQLYPRVGDGFLAYLLPPNDYFKTHPEFFATDERGNRHAGEHPSLGYYENHTMLCLSDPNVFTKSVKNLRAAFAGQKKMGNVSKLGVGLSPPDGTPYCYCDNCKIESLNFKYPRYVHRTTQSEEFFGFAARIAREFPDKLISTMAYSLREIVPQGVEIPPNLMVMYAPISCDVLHANDSQLWRRRDFVRNLKAWRRQTPHIVIYDYNPGLLIGNWVPERDTANMAINAPIYKDIDIKGFQAEGRKAFMQTWISYYTRAKLLWDADTDIETLKHDFYTTFFGPGAGPHVRAWWDACEEALANDPMQAHEDFFINHIYNLDFVRSIHRHVNAARQAPATDVQRQRVEAFALIADHLMAFAAMNDAEMRLDYRDAAAAAGLMVELENRLNQIYSFFIENGPGQQSHYFPAGRQKVFEALAAKIDRKNGVLIAPLPLDMKFHRDQFNEGIVAGWHEQPFDDADWGTKNTYYTWDQQDPPEDEAGHDYDGLGWYRTTFEVPAQFKNRPIKFWCGGVINEGWVWINGKYAGTKRHKIWWYHAHEFELDVTDLIKPGQTNTIAIRVLNDSEIGGMLRRGFFWSPQPKKKP